MQQVGVLITDGGPHPPDKWARMSAQMIVQNIIPDKVMVGDEMQDVEKSANPVVVAFRKARDKFEADIRDLLEEWHTAHQSQARTGGEKVPDIEAHVAAIVDAAAKHHPILHSHLQSKESRKALAHRLHMDLAAVAHIEHGWRRDGFTIDTDHRTVKAG